MTAASSAPHAAVEAWAVYTNFTLKMSRGNRPEVEKNTNFLNENFTVDQKRNRAETIRIWT
jgi:hypothetical protein